jgi:glycosyltransferase involved in cell wall biosynthesis
VTRTRVAAFTPGPPKRTGGAVYAGVLLPALADHVDVVAVAPDPVDWDGPTIPPADFRPDDHDVVLHFLADNTDHLFAYRSALQWGGVVVCHELSLPHLLGSTPADEALDLAEQLGAEGAAGVAHRRSRGLNTHQEAYLLQVLGRPLRQAEAAVVHSRFSKFVVEAEVPGLPVHHVPSHTGAVPSDLEPKAALRQRLGLDPDRFLVGLFGFLGGHKRVTETLQAVADAVPLARARGVEVGLVLVGDAVMADLAGTLAGLGLTDRAIVRTSVDERSFFEHMAAVDTLVTLRYPTLGETSATMLQAMALGQPVITSDHAQFAEERAAIRIPPDEGERATLARALVVLATCPQCASTAAETSRARARECTLEATTAGYLGVVESVLRAR